ncbi:protocadherin-9-like isoform X2 [Anneissia japonica]|uniref:protocadherin-9-like isoform X2 n=1 Tax=Anneissia japonica TaxID=1529436 RepID=UPI0014256166|nr:protocadherin-9-like isoform X2 [Anneissia japonica]
MTMFSWTSGSVFFIIFKLFLCTSKAQHDIVYDLYEEEPDLYIVGNLVENLGLQLGSGAAFSILGDLDSVPFAVNNDGELYTTEVIDREVGKCSEYLDDDCQYNLRILIKDGSNIQVKRVLIRLNDTNDNNPIFFYNQYQIDVSESVAVGTEIPMESAVDEDVGVNDIDTYSLDSTYNGMFGVVVTDTVDGAKTVHLKINQALDRETRDQYNIVLRASDNGTPKREGTTVVVLKIVDSNDNSPQFTEPEYRKSVPEDVPVGYEILNLHAEDTDEGDNAQIEYTFGNSVTSIVKEHFEVDPDDGVIRTIKNLDHERNDVFVMIIEAKDKGQNSISGFATVTIDVTDVNDNAPVLEVSYSADIDREGNTIQILESINVGTFIGLLLASDADSGENGQFDISFDGTYGHFNLIADPSAPKEFAFTAGSGIDREKIPEYNLTIIAQDKGNENNRKTTVLQINIIVNDVNDFTPYFTSPVNRFVMPEHNDPGYLVDTVIASDNDEGLNAEIIYTLEKADGYFQIDPSSGEITAIQSIDRESSASLSFYVSACDKGTPQLCNTTSVIVEILDKNDKQPYFLQQKYSFEIQENKAAQTLIGRVTATDEDVGVNGELRYTLSGSSDNFIINSSTGKIYSKRPFDHEEKKMYRLTVVVSDAGIPAKTNQVIVEIIIKDINDNAPFIAFPTPNNDTFFIPATAPSDFWIINVIAFDIDDGRNGLVEYSIKDGNKNDAFKILSNGTVMTKRDLIKDWQGVYDLKINVTDKALQKKSNVTDLTIVIANKEFSEPLRLSEFYRRFNLSVQYYRDLSRSTNDEANWPYIVVIALGGVAFILFIIFCVLLARCHRKDKMEHTYKVPKEEELFQAGKVSVDGKKDPNNQLVSPAHETNPAPYAQSKNIMKWKMQSPDARLGNKQMMTFSSNSDLNTGSNPSLASTRNTHEADAEVQRLLYKLKINDTDSMSSNSEMDPSSDSGHGDSEHDAYSRHDVGRNHPRNALKNYFVLRQ